MILLLLCLALLLLVLPGTVPVLPGIAAGTARLPVETLLWLAFVALVTGLLSLVQLLVSGRHPDSR
jgi:hypothetical protein